MLLRQAIIMLLTLSGLSMSEMKVHAEDQPSPFVKNVYTGASGAELPYRLLSPAEIKPGEKYPLVLFLHGAGERGTDNNLQLVHVVQELAGPDLRTQYPAFVIAPQCPKELQWVDTPWTAASHTMPENPTVHLALVMELLDSLPETLPIDVERVYYTGLSMGGFGVWDLLQRQPERCAGAIAICGGGDPAYAAGMKDIPIWAFHGDADGAVQVNRSREMVKAIRKAGGRPIYTEYPGVGHNSWTRTGENRLVWDWLFAQFR